MTHEEETENFIEPLIHDDDEFAEDEFDEECYECGGEGWVVDDCFEDTCCCLDPEEDHGIIPCHRCNPTGEF